MPLLSATDHIGPVMAVAWSCDGQLFATASKDKTGKVYESSSNVPIATLRGHSERLNGIAFSPKDSNTVATCSRDKTIKLFKARTGSLIRSLRGHAAEVYAIAFSPDGGKITSASADCNVIVWDVARATILKKLQGHTQPVLAVAFSHAGRRMVASGGEDCVLKIWNASTGAVFRNYEGHEDAITAVKFSCLDQNLVVSASRDAAIRVWHMDTSTTMAMITGHSDAITSLAFSSDGWLLASGSADATCKVWSVTDCLELKTFSGHKNSVSGCSFSPGSAMLATSSWDQSTKVWDVSQLQIHGTNPFGLDYAEMKRATHTPASGTLASRAQQQPVSATVEVSSPQVLRSQSPTLTGSNSAARRSPLSRGESATDVLPSFAKTPQSISKQVTPKQQDPALKDEYRKEHKARVTAEMNARQEHDSRVRLEHSLDELRDHEIVLLRDYKNRIAELETEVDSQIAARVELERSLEVVRESWLYPTSSINCYIELANGALATTHRGFFNGAEVCIRTFHEELRGGYYTEVWAKELNKRALLKHPNIAEFFGASLDFQDHPKMVVQLLPGSLKDVIDLESPLSCREASDIAMGAASGLAYLHRCTLIHGIISTRKILLTCDLQAKITGISEATVVRRSFVNPPPQLLSSVPSSPGPMSSDTIAAQRARDLSMLGCTLIEAAIGRPVAIDDVEANLNRIEWPELQTILARCFHEEGYKADHLLAHLFQLIMSGSFTAYDRCAPRRYIRRLDTGLIFDAPAKAHTLPAIP
eukprot:m.185662 g.185662  ORF g.185662 m.185662 type:complete len:761 (-) comp16916_c0_seq8:3522-5804(-)